MLVPDSVAYTVEHECGCFRKETRDGAGSLVAVVTFMCEGHMDEFLRELEALTAGLHSRGTQGDTGQLSLLEE